MAAQATSSASCDICGEPRENCRSRASILPAASLVIYVYSVYYLVSLIVGLITGDQISIWADQETMQPEVQEQLRFIVAFLTLAYTIHLARIYLSIIILDESVEAFHRYFETLSPVKRGFEFLIRFVVFLGTIWFLEHYIVGQKQIAVSTFGLFGMLIYSLLVFWDLLMRKFCRGMDTTQKTYLFSDVFGLVGFVLLWFISQATIKNII